MMGKCILCGDTECWGHSNDERMLFYLNKQAETTASIYYNRIKKLEAEIEAYEIGSRIEAKRGDELAAKLEIVKEALMEIALIPPYFENEPRLYKELIAQKALERLK